METKFKMKTSSAIRWGFLLPLPGFVLHPLTAVVVAIVHVYLALGHLSHLFGGEVQWTHIWKGFGALGGPTCLRHWRHAGLPGLET